MKFEINPCQAVLKSGGDEGINSISDRCYGVCNAFGSPRGCNDKCRVMIADIQSDNCGRTRPMPPVNWNQTPRFFPDLLTETGSVDRAYRNCVNKCSGVKNSLECRKMCLLDASSVHTEDSVVTSDVVRVTTTKSNSTTALVCLVSILTVLFVVNLVVKSVGGY